MLASKHLDFVLLAVAGRGTLSTGNNKECDEHCEEQSGLHLSLLSMYNLSQFNKQIKSDLPLPA
jgi:hypothetical protein